MRKKGAVLREALGEVGAGVEAGPQLPAVMPDNGLPPPSASARGQSPSPSRGGSLPDFTPVPRRYRHDGWTPERQKAFIEALADTGCVTRAANMVNIAQANCYALRRAPGAEEFRRAWDSALDFGLKRLKDIA